MEREYKLVFLDQFIQMCLMIKFGYDHVLQIEQ